MALTTPKRTRSLGDLNMDGNVIKTADRKKKSGRTKGADSSEEE